MTTVRAFIKRHPVPAYFALAFAISWCGILLVIGGPGAMPGTSEQVETLYLSVMLAWLAGPSVAGLLLTGLVDGRAGFRDLLARLLRWRVAARWYAVALLSAPLLLAAVLLALSRFSPEFLPAIVTTDDRAGLLLAGIGVGLAGGFLEELGWTGFAIPRLRLRYAVLSTGLVMGLLWGAYHFSVIYWAGGRLSGALALVILLAQLFAWLPPFRVLMVWVYGRTESLLVAMLMHASLIASTLFVLQQSATGVALLIYLLVWAAALWGAVAAVAVASGGQLSRQPLPRRMA